MLTIGQKLIQTREILGYKQKAFAETINILPQALIKYEKDQVKPSADLLTKIAEVHKINLNWLLTGNGQMFLDQETQPQEDCICKERSKMLEAFDKLPRSRQEYYHYKIIAEALD